VLLKEGLTMYAIRALQKATYTVMVKRKRNPGEDMGLDRVPKKKPLYNVMLYDEIENPKPVGKVGKIRKAG
jgi:hypothetical protein